MITAALIVLLIINVVSFVVIILSHFEKNEHMHSILEKNIISRNYLNDLNDKILENNGLMRSYISDTNSHVSQLKTHINNIANNHMQDICGLRDIMSKIKNEFNINYSVITSDKNRIFDILTFHIDRIKSVESLIKSMKITYESDFSKLSTILLTNQEQPKIKRGRPRKLDKLKKLSYDEIKQSFREMK